MWGFGCTPNNPPLEMHIWGMGMDIGPLIPIPTSQTLPLLPPHPISPFGENGDGEFWGTYIHPHPQFPIFPIFPHFPRSLISLFD